MRHVLIKAVELSHKLIIFYGFMWQNRGNNQTISNQIERN